MTEQIFLKGNARVLAFLAAQRTMSPEERARVQAIRDAYKAEHVTPYVEERKAKQARLDTHFEQKRLRRNELKRALRQERKILAARLPTPVPTLVPTPVAAPSSSIV